MALLHITQDSFEKDVIQSDKAVLVDFWAAWCGPCKMIAPFVEQLASDYEGRAVVGKLDVDECPGIAQRYDVRSIPTLMVFKGGQVVEKHVGATTKANLAQLLDKAL